MRSRRASQLTQWDEGWFRKHRRQNEDFQVALAGLLLNADGHAGLTSIGELNG